jgi:hypothetical protein
MASFLKPMIRYYSGHFLNGYDMLFKNMIKGMDSVLTMPADYAERSNLLKRIGGS